MPENISDKPSISIISTRIRKRNFTGPYEKDAEKNEERVKCPISPLSTR